MPHTGFLHIVSVTAVPHPIYGTFYAGAAYIQVQ